uniref:Uncharacterized protein n=1 Tax=Knipowitschia caucasica TaxID=637954 RepID=A0AAV2LW99_KNICA
MESPQSPKTHMYRGGGGGEGGRGALPASLHTSLRLTEKSENPSDSNGQLTNYGLGLRKHQTPGRQVRPDPVLVNRCYGYELFSHEDIATD